MDSEYARRLWQYQKVTHFLIEGRPCRRIRYGREGRGWFAGSGPCGDCGARKGQYHGPGCDLERCPACRGQLLSCGCRPEEWTGESG
jgi:hypothetical protein